MEVPYKLVQIEGKGRGLVATRTLEVGELVLSERAFLKISFKSKITSFFRLIEFEPEIRAKLMNLSCPADSSLKDFDDNQILQRKFEANCIAMHTGVENDASLVFEMILMINHSCVPNVVWFPEDADETRKEVRACRRIQEGEEIVASYIELAQLPLRQQRREMLRPRGFFCRSILFSLSKLVCQSLPPRCELCALSGEELEKNEQLRRRLMNLEREYVNLQGEGLKTQGLRKIEQKMEMMEKNWDEFGLLVRSHIAD